MQRRPIAPAPAAQKYTELLSYFLTELTPDVPIDKVQKIYKELSMYYHPDRPTGSTAIFQKITTVYKDTIAERQLAQGVPPAADTRSMRFFGKTREEIAELVQRDHSTGAETFDYGARTNFIDGRRNKELDPNKFDPVRFNQLFDKHRIANPDDAGYGDFMDKATRTDDGYDMERQSAQFAGQRFAEDPSKYQMIEFSEPTFLPCGVSVGFTELGQGAVADYSGCGYTDYKRAYNSRREFDPDTVQLGKARTLDQIKAEREKIDYNMTPEQRQRNEMRERAERERELERQRMVRERDLLYNRQFEAINTLRLAGGK